MRGRRLVLALAAFAVFLCWTVAGASAAGRLNGIEKRSAQQIVAAAISAGASAKTVHVSAKLGQLSFDLQLVAGKGGKGSMVQNGLSFDLVRVGKLAYFRGSDRFWRKFGGSAAVQLLHGRWMRSSATQGDLASLTPLTNLRTLITQALGSHGKLKKGATTTIDGQHVVAITDVTQGGTLYVSTDGPSYPVALRNGKQKGTVTFDRWNENVALAAPKNSIDISKLHK